MPNNNQNAQQINKCTESPKAEEAKSKDILDSINRQSAPVQSPIWEALYLAQRSIRDVEKDAHNEYGGYDYTSAEKMFEVSRKALHDHDLFAYRGDWSIEVKGGHAICQMNFVLKHWKSGSSHTFPCEFPIVPNAKKPMDKAVASALTSGMSYWIRDLLMIPRVDKKDDMDDPGNMAPDEIEKYSGSPKQKERLRSLFYKLKVTDKNQMIHWHNFMLNKPFAQAEKLITDQIKKELQGGF